MPDKAQAAQLRKMRFAMRRVARHLPHGLPPLIALTDPARIPDPVVLAENLPTGAGLIYRHFGAEDRCEVAARLAGISAKRGLMFLVANDAPLARAVGADGVHWPEAKLAEARKWRGCFDIMTCAAHTRAALARAKKAGIDAALLSVIFPSASQSAGSPMGALRFRQLARDVSLPVFALGGVSADNAGQIADNGALAAIEACWSIYVE